MDKVWLLACITVLLLAGCNSVETNAPAEDIAENDEAVVEGEIHWTDFRLVAHAMGGIDGHRYTNSLEAFELSYDNGHRVFEVDFILTADEKIVARHDWNDGVLSYDEFMDKKIEGKYTPLDVGSVYELLVEYDDAYLILDLKADTNDDLEFMYDVIIDTFDDDVLSRTIPQIYHETELDLVKGYYDFDILYTLYRTDSTDWEVIEFSRDNEIVGIVMSEKRFNTALVERLRDSGIISYVHTINEIEEAERYLRQVHGVYTDFLSHEELMR